MITGAAGPRRNGSAELKTRNGIAIVVPSIV